MLVQEGLVDGAGVVVEPAGDGEVDAVVALGHAQVPQHLEHLTELGHARIELGLPALQPGQGLHRVGVGGGATPHELGEGVHGVGRQAEALPGELLAQPVQTALVDLVHLPQHRRLGIVGDAEAPEEAAQQPAVVEVDRERAEVQLAEDRVHGGRRLRIVPDVQRAGADDVHVALQELAVAATLRALPAVDALHLVPPEGEGQLPLVLGDEARHRHREVKAQGEVGQRLGTVRGCGLAPLAVSSSEHRIAVVREPTCRLDEVDLLLGLAAGLGEQHVGALERGGLQRQEATGLEMTADHVEHPVERDLLARQQLERSLSRTGRGDR